MSCGTNPAKKANEMSINHKILDHEGEQYACFNKMNYIELRKAVSECHLKSGKKN